MSALNYPMKTDCTRSPMKYDLIIINLSKNVRDINIILSVSFTETLELLIV